LLQRKHPANDVNPYEWLKETLEKIPSTKMSAFISLSANKL